MIKPPFYGINAAAAPYSDATPRYLRITDITSDGSLVKTGLASVVHPLADKYLLEDGDVALARTGASIGKSFLYSFQTVHSFSRGS